MVTALLGRFDVHNVLTLLRQHHHGTEPGTAAAPLVPVGRLDAETALEAAGQPDLPAAARLLAARGLPDSGSAEVLLTAQRRYEIDADLACIEQAVAVCARAHQMKVLTAAGPAADLAADALRRETDDLNLLLALGLRESANGRARGSAADAIAQAYLPGGTVPPLRLATIGQAPARADVLAAAAPVRAAWRGPLAAWAERSDLATLHADLDTERLRTEFRLLRRADPVGAATILHYVLAHETQARNLRLLAHAAVGAVSQATVRRHLVIPK